MPSNSGRTSKIRMYSVLMILSIIHATIPFTPSSVPVNVGNVDLRKIPHFNVWHGNVQDVEKDVEVRLAMSTFNNVFGDNVSVYSKQVLLPLFPKNSVIFFAFVILHSHFIFRFLESAKMEKSSS